MSISLIMPGDDKAKILVTLPYKQKNGHVKEVEFFIPKLNFVDRDVMNEHRDWITKRTADYESAKNAWQEARVAAIKDKTVEVPERPVEPTHFEAMCDLALRVFPDEWNKYLEPLPNGPKLQLFEEWSKQSLVTPGESEASSTSSTDQE